MKHSQLNLIAFKEATKDTETFKKFETFKKGIFLKLKNIEKLYDYYQQANRLGIDYLKQNPNIFANDVAIIDEIINK